MGFEHTWRWFGPNDPVTLKEIKQTGATGIVNALHQIPVGEIWPKDEILKRKQMIESEGFSWSVVESLPVHENIKKRNDNYKDLIENYKLSLRNLARCGIDTVCYNFMPVLDWSRTDLKVINPDGSISSKFNSNAFRAFELFILERETAVDEYTEDQLNKAKEYFDGLDEIDRQKLVETILYGLPGSMEAYSLDQFKLALHQYDQIGEDELRSNLLNFIKEIIPVADEFNLRLAIHPDDPPWSLLGLPRVVGSHSDLKHILEASFSPSNGITFCSGSLGASIENNLEAILRSFSDRVNFVHLRNVKRNHEHDFIETYHLEGEINLYNIIKELLEEQQRRIQNGRTDYRIPMRPDHGHLMIPEFNKEGIYPGYSLNGRMRGLAELRGLEMGIAVSLGIS